MAEKKQSKGAFVVTGRRKIIIEKCACWKKTISAAKINRSACAINPFNCCTPVSLYSLFFVSLYVENILISNNEIINAS